MEIFSKTCEYAIKAVLYLYTKQDRFAKIGIPEIAREIKSPVSFTAKILQKLSQRGLIRSAKGPGGGFYIGRKRKSIFILDIVNAIDGKESLNTCALGLKNCSSSRPCPMHFEILDCRKAIRNLLGSQSIEELSKKILSNEVYLVN
ncbi:MAG: Rrf2 family transcriptional regulator [Flavobacteriales bacterium]|nr:Rrf2 family transcriptional regulator [Flavobacteriales bacterium]